jgi:hypothetical protein
MTAVLGVGLIWIAVFLLVGGMVTAPPWHGLFAFAAFAVGLVLLRAAWRWRSP